MIKAEIIVWESISDGTKELNKWFEKNPNIKIISTNVFGYGYVNQYGSNRNNNNYTQIIYEPITNEMEDLSKLLNS